MIVIDIILQSFMVIASLFMLCKIYTFYIERTEREKKLFNIVAVIFSLIAVSDIVAKYVDIFIG